MDNKTLVRLEYDRVTTLTSLVTVVKGHTNDPLRKLKLNFKGKTSEGKMTDFISTTSFSINLEPRFKWKLGDDLHID